MLSLRCLEIDAMKHFLRTANKKTKASLFVMGLGQILYGQITKGILLMLFEIASVCYLIFFGAQRIYDFFTLGTLESNPWTGVVGDNSIIMLLVGILVWIFLGLFLFVYIHNIKSAYATQKRVEAGFAPKKFHEELKDLLDGKLYIVTLSLPVLGICVFTILPIVFMILIAFTNYGDTIVPPRLVDWVGLDTFKRLLTLSQIAPTFFKITSWNFIWAIVSTSLNYLGGLGFALLINKECVKWKAFWRTFPMLAYAIPGFITLIGFKFMFSYGGPINQLLVEWGHKAIGFLDIDAGWTLRIIGFGVNAWISIPAIMLLATGILANMDGAILEAARIDGANRAQRFRRITLPFMLFSTTPVLLSQFVLNFNNFGIFYFLRGRMYLEGYFNASDTDLLINWLYNLSIDNNYYNIAAAISLVLFVITSIISLAAYVRSNSYKKEDMFQ